MNEEYWEFRQVPSGPLVRIPKNRKPRALMLAHPVMRPDGDPALPSPSGLECPACGWPLAIVEGPVEGETDGKR